MCKRVLAAAVLGWFVLPVHLATAQIPLVLSLGNNGVLTCTNLEPGSTATVEWSASPTGPWTNNWAGLDVVTVASNKSISVSVPMFYRVRGVAWTPPAPNGMVLIPAGTFTMGDGFLDWPADWGPNPEIPTNRVTVSAYYMDQYEVTKALWRDVFSWAITNGYSFDNGGMADGTNHPVNYVNWVDCVKWCNARSEKEGKVPAYYTDAAQTTVYRSGILGLSNACVKWDAGYRLPTEAEWERAARGGVEGHRFPWTDTDNISTNRANYTPHEIWGATYDLSYPSYTTGTVPVGSYAPNAYGLYDMAGNVHEWCWDWWIDHYDAAPKVNPRGPESGTWRAMRGGSWYANAAHNRVAQRLFSPATDRYIDRGFRTILPVGM